MKKILILALGLSLCLNLYLIDSSVEVVNDFDEQVIESPKRKTPVVDKVRLAQSSLSTKVKQVSTNKECTCSEKATTSSLENEQPVYDQKEISKKITEITNDWMKKSNNFFYDDLRLRDEQIERYKELVQMRKIETDEYFNPKVKKAEESANTKEGQPSYYVHSTEDTVFMGKLAERYDTLLKENFGDQAFSDYKKFIHNYNKEIAREDFFFPIEF